MRTFKLPSELSAAVDEIVRKSFNCAPADLLGKPIRATNVHFEGTGDEKSESILFLGTIASVTACCNSRTNHELWVMIIPNSQSPSDEDLWDEYGDLGSTKFVLKMDENRSIVTHWLCGDGHLDEIDELKLL